MIPTLKRALSAIVGAPRSFVAGVRAIPELEQVLRAAAQAVKHANRYGSTELAKQLAAEREARDKFQRLWQDAMVTSGVALDAEREECDNLKCAISIIRDAIEHQRAYAASTGHDADMWRSEGIAWCQNLMRCYDGFTIDNRIGDLHQSQERLVGENLGLLRKNKELKQQLASALDRLDKLTRWRAQEEFQIPLSVIGLVEIDLSFERKWRHTPESLQALEESEGGDGK